MDSSMTCWICCGGRPPGGKFLVPRRGRAPRRYLSDKQRTPRSRGAKHVAKCGPKVLTPKWVRGTPLREPVHRAGRDGKWRAGAFSAPDISVRRQDCKNGSSLSSGWINPHRPPPNPDKPLGKMEARGQPYVCTGKCV